MKIFLIDADNLNASAWIEEAFRILVESEGALPVRRAYGSSENLKSLAEPLRVWAVRPFVNLSLSKNTTDVALAVDAMEFACQLPAPRTIIIGSGDADFVPLVVRLRERGIRVVCVSERSKMSREAVSAYDRVILVGQDPSPQDDISAAAAAPAPHLPAGRPATAKKSPAKKAATAKTPAKASAAKTASPTPSRSRKKQATVNAPDLFESMAPDSVASPLLPPDVEAILKAVASLQSGQAQPLAAVAKALLDAKLRGKNLTATKLLKRYPQHFALLPLEKPRTVTYTPVHDAS